MFDDWSERVEHPENERELLSKHDPSNDGASCGESDGEDARVWTSSSAGATTDMLLCGAEGESKDLQSLPGTRMLSESRRCVFLYCQCSNNGVLVLRR